MSAITDPGREVHWRAQYEAAERRAFENHVLELARAFAKLQEEAEREIRGVDPNPTIRGAELAGEYPESRIDFRVFDRVRELEQTHGEYIWGDDFRDGGEMRSPQFIASEMLMRARGG